jgi:hypothetical protein
LAQRGTNSLDPTPLEHLLGLQSAVLMFMIAMLTVIIMVHADNPKVVHGYVIASALTDLPHWAAFFSILGWDGIRQVHTWNTALWLQLVVPIVTMVFKLGYLSGLFGEDQVSMVTSKPETEKGRKAQ